MYNSNETPNTGTHIHEIMNLYPCTRHKHAGAGVPCWELHLSVDKRRAPALCGARIKLAGYVGKITSDSLRLRPVKPTYPHSRKR
jgi:hypothetical protein